MVGNCGVGGATSGECSNYRHLLIVLKMASVIYVVGDKLYSEEHKSVTLY